MNKPRLPTATELQSSSLPSVDIVAETRAVIASNLNRAAETTVTVKQEPKPIVEAAAKREKQERKGCGSCNRSKRS